MAKAKLAVGKAAIAQAQGAISHAEASLRRSQQNFEYCTIRSPVKGVIIDRRVNTGQTVVASLSAPSLFSLSLLLGREPAALARELSAEAPIPVTPPEVPVGLPSDLLRRRPDIRRAERQLHAATARIRVASADLFPRFSLSGSFGLSGSTAGSLTDWANRFWGVGPTVSWPVFDAGRIRADIEVQNALQEETLIAYQQTVLTALKDVETALVANGKEQEHRQSLSEAVAYKPQGRRPGQDALCGRTERFS